MDTKLFNPSPKYLTKFRLNLTIIAILVILGALLLAGLMNLDPSINNKALNIMILVFTGLDLLWWIPSMILARPYYHSLSYEIHDDEVVVRAGIITQAVKHVPYRTVTNITVKRGIFDRWFFNLGTLNIQTAGMSGQTGAEESLVGLPNYEEVYLLVATELRRFRGAMSPTAAEVDEEFATGSEKILQKILAEVQNIRQELNKSAK
ncbi:MAG: PH domain-containing protein [Anaerolineales bacterium]|nr:PH domain-containing protein [Anaerolineales bacterium]